MKQNKNVQSGFISMIAILAIGVLALSSALTIAAGSISELAKNQNTTSGNETFYTAESALLEGAYQYIQAIIDSDPDTNYEEGNGELLNKTDTSIITVDDTDWPYAIVRGESENNTTTRGVTRRITVFPEGLAFDHSVFANHNLLLGGSAVINGSIFANEDINFNGNPPITGDIYAGDSVNDPSNNIDGEIHEEAEPIPPPEIKLDDYEIYAFASSTLFTAAANAASYAEDSPEEYVVIFVDDTEETKIQGANLIGSIATTHDLQLTSGGTYTAFGNFAAIVVYGDLKLAGGVVINGIVYVKGETTFSGGGATINGSLISTGGIDTTNVTGNVTINYIPSDWQDLEGLEKESTESPRLLEWGEE